MMQIKRTHNHELGVVLLTPRKQALGESTVGTVVVPNANAFAFFRIVHIPTGIDQGKAGTTDSDSTYNTNDIYFMRKSEFDIQRKFEDSDIKGNIHFVNPSFIVGSLSEESKEAFEEFGGKTGVKNTK